VHSQHTRPTGSNFFQKIIFFWKFSFSFKIRFKARAILRKGRGGEGSRRGERPNILNIVAWRNNLATFDSQQLATLVALVPLCSQLRIYFFFNIFPYDLLCHWLAFLWFRSAIAKGRYHKVHFKTPELVLASVAAFVKTPALPPIQWIEVGWIGATHKWWSQGNLTCWNSKLDKQ